MNKSGKCVTNGSAEFLLFCRDGLEHDFVGFRRLDFRSCCFRREVDDSIGCGCIFKRGIGYRSEVEGGVGAKLGSQLIAGEQRKMAEHGGAGA